MENKTKKIFFVVFAILIIGAFAYQQIVIGRLNKTIKEIGEVSGITGKNDNLGENKFMERAVKNTVETETKDFTGVVVSKEAGSLGVEGNVVSLSKILDLSADELEKSAELPKEKKKFIVNVNEKTEMPVKFEMIKIGDNVHIFSEKSIYEANFITASKVWVLSDSKSADIAANNFFETVKYIGGPIKEIASNYYVIDVQWVDYPKDGSASNLDLAMAPKIAKTYKVLISDKTVFSKNSRNDLKVGDDVNAYSDSPVFSLAQFTATKIEGPIQQPGN